jgi:mRNA interferase ChpB
MAIFDRGDIVRACLNSTAGNELQGDMRPCLVLSPKAFNKLGLTLIAPITQGGNFARFQGFSVPLMGTETQGVILANGVRSVDFKARKANKIESVPSDIVDEALAILSAILE